MYSYGEATIDCAMIDGELRHIDDFEDVPAHERPVALCQTCNNPLIYSYGDFKVHHFRHQPGDECSGGGEGMEHHQAKLCIATALKETNSIKAFNRCSWCNSLGGKIKIEYNDVRLEYVFDNGKKADVALLKDSDFCASIEVFVSHRCELPKIYFHRNSGIPCFEVQAQTVSTWTVGKNLTPDALYGVEQFICIFCESREQERKAATQSKPEPAKPLQPEPFPELIRATLKGRKVVWCRSNYRENRELVFEVIEYTKGLDLIKRLQVREGVLDTEILCEVKAPFTESQRKLFNQKYDEFIEKLRVFNYELIVTKWKTE